MICSSVHRLSFLSSLTFNLLPETPVSMQSQTLYTGANGELDQRPFRSMALDSDSSVRVNFTP
jgi:hypothetical protein